MYLIGKLSSSLCKHINNANLLLYPIYLLKLHKTILKYYRLNLFKETMISFNHGLQMSSESLASLYNGLLAERSKYLNYPYLQSIFDVFAQLRPIENN